MPGHGRTAANGKTQGPELRFPRVIHANPGPRKHIEGPAEGPQQIKTRPVQGIPGMHSRNREFPAEPSRPAAPLQECAFSLPRAPPPLLADTGTHQNGFWNALPLGDDIKAVVHSINQEHIGMPRRTPHGLNTPGPAPLERVSGWIRDSQVRLRLDNDKRPERPIRLSHGQPAPQ